MLELFTRRSMWIAGSLAVAAMLGACAKSNVASLSYTGPGWYLEKPRVLLPTGPQIFGGPFTYEQCESERTKLPGSTAERMLCNRELVTPGAFGPY